MTDSNNRTPQPRTLRDIAYDSLLGLAFGLLLALVLAMLISLSTLEWQWQYLAILAGLAACCGLLTAIWGKRFLGPLVAFLESIPPIA